MSIDKVFEYSEIILTKGGAIAQRLITEFNLEMDDYINHEGLIYSSPDILELLCRRYLDIGLEFDLPMKIMTPTQKVNFESIRNSNF